MKQVNILKNMIRNSLPETEFSMTTYWEKKSQSNYSLQSSWGKSLLVYEL